MIRFHDGLKRRLLGKVSEQVHTELARVYRTCLVPVSNPAEEMEKLKTLKKAEQIIVEAIKQIEEEDNREREHGSSNGR